MKTFRFLTLPVQFAAGWQDRLARHLERVKAMVPESRQVQAPPEVAIPVLESLRTVPESGHLAQMFLELLATSIDRDRQGDVHPAFPGMIGQLSPDEATILYVIRDGEDRMQSVSGLAKTPVPIFPVEELARPDLFRMFLERLIALTLVDTKWKQDPTLREFGVFSLSAFGKFFVKVCVPEGGFAGAGQQEAEQGSPPGSHDGTVEQ